jgi:hypothetical protein
MSTRYRYRNWYRHRDIYLTVRGRIAGKGEILQLFSRLLCSMVAILSVQLLITLKKINQLPALLEMFWNRISSSFIVLSENVKIFPARHVFFPTSS